MEVGSDDTLHHGWYPCRCRLTDDCGFLDYSLQANAQRVLHGANRLGGNSLSDLLVFGKRAGEYAAQFAMEKCVLSHWMRQQFETIAAHTLKPFENPADDGSGETLGPYDIQAQLQEKNAGSGRHRSQSRESYAGVGRDSKTCARKQRTFTLSAIANTTPDGTQRSILTVC